MTFYGNVKKVKVLGLTCRGGQIIDFKSYL